VYTRARAATTRHERRIRRNNNIFNVRTFCYRPGTNSPSVRGPDRVNSLRDEARVSVGRACNIYTAAGRNQLSAGLLADNYRAAHASRALLPLTVYGIYAIDINRFAGYLP